MAEASQICVKLDNGVQIPVVGFGTAFFTKVDGVEARIPEKAWFAVNEALKIGYRHIDTAFMYGCETHVRDVLGSYLMRGSLKREDIFITSKAGHPPCDCYPNAKTEYVFDLSKSAYDGITNEFYQSLENLGVGYVDLYLMHWPGGRAEPDMLPVELAQIKRIEMWRALEDVYEKKLARAVGVSNFSISHLTHLMKNCRIKPMMNQIEINPLCQQSDLVQFCKENEIVLTAYSPFGNGSHEVLKNEVLLKIASRMKVSVGEVILAWMTQQGIVVIPKSSNPNRMKKNLESPHVVLQQADMDKIATLNKGFHQCPSPNNIN